MQAMSDAVVKQRPESCISQHFGQRAGGRVLLQNRLNVFAKMAEQESVLLRYDGVTHIASEQFPKVPLVPPSFLT
jgi:hypothetical protein